MPGVTRLARRLRRAIWQMSLCSADVLLRRRAGVITQILCGIISWTSRLPWRRNDPARRWQDASAGGIQDAEPAPGEGDRSGVRAVLLLRSRGPGPGQVRDGAPLGDRRRAGRNGRGGLRVL